MEQFLEQVVSRLQRLNYTQSGEAHLLRYKVSGIVKSPALKRRVNGIKFNGSFLDDAKKRKRIFEQSRSRLINIIQNNLS